MRLLVKQVKNYGLAAHIPDVEGRPLCGLHLKLSDWALEAPTLADTFVCGHCLRKAKAQERMCERSEREAGA